MPALQFNFSGDHSDSVCISWFHPRAAITVVNQGSPRAGCKALQGSLCGQRAVGKMEEGAQRCRDLDICIWPWPRG